MARVKNEERGRERRERNKEPRERGLGDYKEFRTKKERESESRLWVGPWVLKKIVFYFWLTATVTTTSNSLL